MIVFPASSPPSTLPPTGSSMTMMTTSTTVTYAGSTRMTTRSGSMHAPEPPPYGYREKYEDPRTLEITEDLLTWEDSAPVLPPEDPSGSHRPSLTFAPLPHPNFPIPNPPPQTSAPLLDVPVPRIGIPVLIPSPNIIQYPIPPPPQPVAPTPPNPHASTPFSPRPKTIHNTQPIAAHDLDDRYYLSVDIMGKKIFALLDPGSTRSYIGDGVARALNLELTPATGGAHAANDEVVPIKGEIRMALAIGETRKTMEIRVAPFGFEGILGIDFCKVFGITIDHAHDTWTLPGGAASTLRPHSGNALLVKMRPESAGLADTSGNLEQEWNSSPDSRIIPNPAVQAPTQIVPTPPEFDSIPRPAESTRSQIVPPVEIGSTDPTVWNDWLNRVAPVLNPSYLPMKQRPPKVHVKDFSVCKKLPEEPPPRESGPQIIDNGSSSMFRQGTHVGKGCRQPGFYRTAVGRWQGIGYAPFGPPAYQAAAPPPQATVDTIRRSRQEETMAPRAIEAVATTPTPPQTPSPQNPSPNHFPNGSPSFPELNALKALQLTPPATPKEPPLLRWTSNPPPELPRPVPQQATPQPHSPRPSSSPRPLMERLISPSELHWPVPQPPPTPAIRPLMAYPIPPPPNFRLPRGNGAKSRRNRERDRRRMEAFLERRKAEAQGRRTSETPEDTVPDHPSPSGSGDEPSEDDSAERSPPPDPEDEPSEDDFEIFD